MLDAHALRHARPATHLKESPPTQSSTAAPPGVSPRAEEPTVAEEQREVEARPPNIYTWEDDQTGIFACFEVGGMELARSCLSPRPRATAFSRREKSSKLADVTQAKRYNEFELHLRNTLSLPARNDHHSAEGKGSASNHLPHLSGDDRESVPRPGGRELLPPHCRGAGESAPCLQVGWPCDK